MSLESGAGIRPRTEKTEEEGKGALESWKGVKSLNDKERDEIEFQVKVMIKRCLGRIKELEKGEEGEAYLVVGLVIDKWLTYDFPLYPVRKRTTASLSANPFLRLLGSASTSSFPGRNHPLYAEQLSQHRAAITQYLSKELASANGKLGDMQEARLRSQQKRRINLGGSAAATRAAGGGMSDKQAIVAGSVSIKSKSSSFSGNKTLAMLPPGEDNTETTLQVDFSASDLTPQQVQQFEEESSALIKSLSEDLSAIEATEKKLSEISELQTQLIQHLGSQAEVSDLLNQEAIGHTLEVGKGNEQLQKAKDNNRQASKFLCIFLIGSGVGLLFLHCE